MEQTSLSRQAASWKRQQKRGEMPTELFEIIAAGTTGHAKRVIINLARHSEIVDDSGNIRPYDEFKHDWVYSHSIYGVKDTCALCGKRPIVENCLLVDAALDREIVVGNTCVHRYIEIKAGDSNRVLTGDEKREFLTGQMKEAKAAWNRQKFAEQYPAAMLDLARFEAMMTQAKKLKVLHRTMIRRLATVGYPGPKLWRQWDEFMQTADERFSAWSLRQEEAEQRRQAALAESKLRRAAMAAEIAKRRDEWDIIATEWVERALRLESDFNSWEKKAVGRVARHIRASGLSNLPRGLGRFKSQTEMTLDLMDGEVEGLSDSVKELVGWMNNSRLNEWERGFVRSVSARSALGFPLSESQRKIIERIRLMLRGCLV